MMEITQAMVVGAYLEILRSRPWPSRSRILDVALSDAMNGLGWARKWHLSRGSDPWGGVTSQELAFAEKMAEALGLEVIDNLYLPEYERAAQLGERVRDSWERS